MPDNFFDRERAALVRLAGAVQSRAAAEAEAAAAFTAAGDKADREVNRARKANAAAREQQLGEIDAAHDAALAEITGRLDSEQYAANRHREEQRAARSEKFRAADQKGRNEYKDRLWTLDSVLEGEEKRARDQMEVMQRKAAAGKERVQELWAEAEPILGKSGATREEVEYRELYPVDEDDPINRLQKSIKAGEAALEAVRGVFWRKLKGVGGLVLSVAVIGGIAANSFAFLDPEVAAGVTGGVGLAFGVALWFVFRAATRRQTLTRGKVLGERLAAADRAAQLLHDFAAGEHAVERGRITEKNARKRRETDAHFVPLLEANKLKYENHLERIVAEHAAAMASILSRRESETRGENDGSAARRGATEARLDAELKAAELTHADKLAAAAATRDAVWTAAATEWHAATAEVSATFADLRVAGMELFPAWEAVASGTRALPTAVPQGVRFGELTVDLQSLPDAISADPRLAPPPDIAGPLPAFLPFPDKCSVVLKAREDGRAAAVTTLQAMMLRFLTGLPPGKVRFTIVDPVSLGENFASFMHLADFDEKLVTAQIWTEPRAIEQRLTDLTDHIRSVIQKYLRNQYKSIEDYNRAAGEVAEPYRVLVVANFPAAFTPEAAKRLVSIVNSGPSCGVCTLLSVDAKAAMPRDFALADLEAPSLVLNWRDGQFQPKDAAFAPFPLALDQPPAPDAVARLVQRVGQASKDAVRVEVPFDYIAPKPEEVWTASASKGFDVAVGRAGATRRQTFRLGRGTSQHALIAGKTGSGKSTLLHALIANLALNYSPEEAELYLIDFKEGVEFQWYANYRLPHARVVAIQSEREFGLSVLQRLDGILKERGEKFREGGVNDLAGYREYLKSQDPPVATGGLAPICPRILLLVDEFQQFFVEDDKLAQEASLLLDRLVRQGRAFGLHVVLGSQTLGGSYSLPRSTIDQMAVRVALQCSDADAQLILNKDNTAARLLSRPGEAIYNDQNGLVEGNDPFQVVWLSEEKREQLLQELHERAGDRYPPPLVFEGNSAADPAVNKALAKVLDAPAWGEAKAVSAWLGDPVAIKEPTAAVFRPLGSANLLLIGQNEDAARGLFAASLLGLAGQLAPHSENLTPQPPSREGKGEEDGAGSSPPSRFGKGAGGLGSAQFTVLDGTPDDGDDAEYLRKLAGRLPQRSRVPNRSELPAAMAELAAELDRRQKGESTDRTPRFLFVFGIHRFRELRKSEDDFGFGRRGAEREPTPAERFALLLREGPPLGIHLVVWCDSLTSLNRSFERPQLREFGLRVLFQMSATDSSTLMDTPAASRLGRNRALYLQEEQERPEKFRPYGLPDPAWLDRVCEQLHARVGLKERAAGV